MSLPIAAVLYAIFLWWISTGAVLYLVNLPGRTIRISLMGASMILLASLWGLAASARLPTAGGAYLGFTCGLLIWGWHEICFLTGVITGPRKRGCERHCRGWRRFLHASQAILYHELAILATLAVVAMLSWGQSNQVGMWTFAALWGMRLSAKLNIFLGVRNLAEDWLPEQLDYLKTYFRKRKMNALFPASLVVSLALLGVLVERAVGLAGVGGAGYTGTTLLAALLGLAVLEHLLMMMPVADPGLWQWANPSPTPSGGPDE